MITVIVTYKLRKGVDVEEYKKYVLKRDYPELRGYEEIEDFNTHIVRGPTNEIDIFEVVRVESWEKWQKLSEKKELQENIKIWESLADKSTLKEFYGEKLK